MGKLKKRDEQEHETGESGSTVLFITAGGDRVDIEKATVAAGEPFGRADAAFARAETGFAIGGVSPIGRLTAPKAYFDRKLLVFSVIYAASGTPHHIFPIDPRELLNISDAQLSDFV